jgi:sucrose-6-phosphate hydrolase SacC (GH32 family)
MDLSHISDSRIIVNLFGKNIKIEPAMNLIRVGENTMPLSVSGCPGKLRMIVDTCSIELFSEDGEAIMTSPLLCDYNLNALHLYVDDQTTINALTVTALAP